jgi:UDP-N-acetylglucosamine 2-epimerase (non-hydrolysing)
VTGNTVIDALHHVLAHGYTRPPQEAAWLADDHRRMVLVTAHRRESWGDGMASIADAVATIARRRPDTLVVYALHMNPIVRKPLLAAVEGLRNVVMLEPQDYSSFSWLLQRCTLVLSDSGGIQEEAPALGKPVLVMRDNTERPEGISAGTARLVGTDRQGIIREVGVLLDDVEAYQRMARAINPYGDGQAARRSVDALMHFCRTSPRPEDFPAAA